MALELHPQWRNANEATTYPFAATASLRNRTGAFILEGTFLDAALYPAGNGFGLYLSKVVVTPQKVTVTIGDSRSSAIASGEFSAPTPPSAVSLTSPDGRPAGVLVTSPSRLAALVAIGGTQEFTREQTEFCASVVFPRPVAGVTAFQLPDGTIFSGEVWFVGGPGVVFKLSQANIDVHIIGDPLFRRRLCEGFTAPRFLTSVRVVSGAREFTLTPDAFGSIQIAVDDTLTSDPGLRVVPSTPRLLFQGIDGQVSDM